MGSKGERVTKSGMGIYNTEAVAEQWSGSIRVMAR
jgi:hypothetical protein